MKQRVRLYRKRGRYYADLRDYRDVGGGQEAMSPPGVRSATRDLDEAQILLAARLEELQELRRLGPAAVVSNTRLSEYARKFLDEQSVGIRESTWARKEIVLRRFVSFFGDPRLSEITADAVAAYIKQRLTEDGLRGNTIRPRTVRKELGQLAQLLGVAIARGVIRGPNPVNAVPWPRVDEKEPVFHEPGDIARAIEAAFLLAADPRRRLLLFMGELVATFALTGGRCEEVYGLLVRDIDLEDNRVWFRSNDWRGIKTTAGRRHMRLWPQLREYLEPYIRGHDGEPDDLLFPGRNGMLTDLGYGFDRIAEKAGLENLLRPHGLRHTYASMRVQTLDHGYPISLLTVAREMGHKNVGLIEGLYGHLQNDRVRAEVVEYRIKDAIPIRAKGLAG